MSKNWQEISSELYTLRLVECLTSTLTYYLKKFGLPEDPKEEDTEEERVEKIVLKNKILESKFLLGNFDFFNKKIEKGVRMEKDKIYFVKDYEVKTPSRGTDGSAGIDFYVPEFSDEFFDAFLNKNTLGLIYKDIGIGIKPQQSVLIPSGIRVYIPKGTVLIAFNKSGVATKRGLVVGACVIDSDYTGVVHLHVINTTDDIQYVNFGEKLVQFLHLPYFESKVVEIDRADYNSLHADTKRGEGGFGSTN